MSNLLKILAKYQTFSSPIIKSDRGFDHKGFHIIGDFYYRQAIYSNTINLCHNTLIYSNLITIDPTFIQLIYDELKANNLDLIQFDKLLAETKQYALLQYILENV